MKKIKEFWATLPENITVTRLDGILIAAICTLAGVIVGMLCSPRKELTVGCGNGCTTNHNWETDEEEAIWDDDEDVVTFN